MHGSHLFEVGLLCLPIIDTVYYVCRRDIFSEYDELYKASPAATPATVSNCHIPSERSAFCPPLMNRYVGHRRTPLGGSTFSSVTSHGASPVEAQ